MDPVAEYYGQSPALKGETFSGGSPPILSGRSINDKLPFTPSSEEQQIYSDCNQKLLSDQGCMENEIEIMQTNIADNNPLKTEESALKMSIVPSLPMATEQNFFNKPVNILGSSSLKQNGLRKTVGGGQKRNVRISEISSLP